MQLARVYDVNYAHTWRCIEERGILPRILNQLDDSPAVRAFGEQARTFVRKQFTKGQNPLPKHRAIIFDLDGTLLDTIDDLADAMNAALAQCGYPARSVREYKRLVGEGMDAFARGALPSSICDEETIAELTHGFRAEYANNWTCKTKPYPGIAELLNEISARGIPIAVLSNKRDTVVQQALNYFLPSIPFAEVRGARPAIPLKPDPAAALQIAEMLDTEPRHVLFVGDTRTDMQTATSAGMVAIGVLWGFRTADELRANGAQQLVESPSDILAMLDGFPAA